jgi:amino acid adenylation domain-containing protein
VVAVPEPDRFTLRCWHSTEVQDESDVAAFVARMQALLVRAAADPSRPVGALPLASADDEALLARVNATHRAWDAPHTVAERVFAVDPARTAVDDGDRPVTYGELSARARAVRDLLVSQGIRPGDVVALSLGRSAGLAAAVLGVWAAGAAYLPLSSDQPESRLAYQVRSAGAKLVLSDSGAPWAEVPVLSVLPPPGSPASTVDSSGGGCAVDPAAAAYVIFTSGSTGQPKAVEVTHRSLANLVLDFADRLPAGSARAVLWSTAFTFDISALELLLPLATGGTLVVAPDDALLKPRALLDLVRAADVSLVQATPTAWRIIAPEAADELAGRVLLCGGEPLPASLAARLRALGGPLFNVYGPTETTIWSTAARLDDDPTDPVPVGVPLANTRVFVTDPTGQHLPPGLPGELCVAGDGVSAGYPQRPDLTADRFGTDPAHGRFYRTGDIATLGHDGVLTLAGRTDRQIKLRGHRIELDEVEAVLHTHPDVALAAVTLVGDPQADGRLVAHVQARRGAARHALRDALWAHARESLPAAAVPSGISVVDRLPTTPNGKVDRQALGDAEPAPPTAVSSADDGLVATLTGLWRDALRRPDVGPHDNFFLHGGHSILAARLAARIVEVTGHEVGVRAVFTHPTPAQLAATLGDVT